MWISDRATSLWEEGRKKKENKKNDRRRKREKVAERENAVCCGTELENVAGMEIIGIKLKT